MFLFEIPGQAADLGPAAMNGPGAVACYQWKASAFDQFLKRSVDIVGALGFFILFGPLYLLIALCVGLSTGAPVHFSQARVGKNGQRFRFFKFRSMVNDAESVLEEHLRSNASANEEWSTFQNLKKDPRVTRVGRIIRKTSFDELPQFWNVLKGEMSLVGPRPCMEGQCSLHGDDFSYYCAVRPGITGLWQVSGRNRVPYARRVELDVLYVRKWSMWLDLKILAKTFRAVVTGD